MTPDIPIKNEFAHSHAAIIQQLDCRPIKPTLSQSSHTQGVGSLFAWLPSDLLEEWVCVTKVRVGRNGDRFSRGENLHFLKCLLYSSVCAKLISVTSPDPHNHPMW